MMKKILIVFFAMIMGCSVFANEATIYNLENGQTVIIKEVHSNPIVTVDTWIKTGSINENDKNNGVSHFLEHLFFKGSTNHAPGEFDKILETKGAITNAATSKDFTHYYITIPSNYFDLALELHADMLLHPLIPRKELEKERKVVIEEIAKDETEPQSVVYDNLVSLLYTTHPYKRQVIGTRDIISTIHRDEILNYYNQFYVPSNMVTIVVGDVDTQKTLELIKKYFNCEQKKVVKENFAQEKQLTEQKRKIDYLATQSGYMLIGFRGVKATNNDTYALDVLSTILGDGRSSVFYRNIKDQQQLAFSIGASNAGFKDDGIFYISANFVPENLTKLENAVFEEIENIQKNGVTSQQVELAKNIIERDTYYSRESISNIAQEIGYTMVITDDINYYKNYIDNIKKVTLADVKRVANKYLGKDKSAVSIILPENSKEVEISANLPTKEVKPAVLVSEALGTKKYQLSNGANLLLTSNDVNEIIAISIWAKGGTFLDKIPGTSVMTADVMMKGTRKYSSVELAKVLEDNGIKIEPSVRADAFTVNVLTTKPEYEKTMEILNEVINNATFDDYEIEKARNEKLNKIKRNRDIPLQVAIENYKSLIFEGSPYSYTSKIFEKTYPKIGHEEIVDYYNKIFAPQNVVISVNGNVESEKVINDFTKIFENKKGETFNYANYSQLINRLTSQKDITKVMPDTKTDWIFIAWQVPGVDNKKDYAALQVIDSLLGSGMSSRLFKNIRDQEGLAYQLGSGYGPNVLKGSFVVYIGTNPQSMEKAKSLLLKEVFRLKKEFITSKELQEAKDKLIGNYIISLETNLEKASSIGWYEISGRGYSYKDEYIRLINSVTESDIIEVANKYFNDNYVISIVKPQ